ncbi:MAG TPA: ParB/RepB/Spo0J family partition protein [Bryobacteraceae bacterium]|jgi:ParB family chromosome partitioning protein|nr:ParB/RepB/Spo0J family partition protein [Bryobacteraceae bacterium]
MQTEELQTLEIPLNKLLAWNDNARITGVEEGIGELADSIASVGLLQGLVVKKEPRGKYAVIAGRRRLMALSQLVADGKTKATMPVPCRVAPKDADLPEISLTENVVRVPMHPADEFEAFQRLITAGKSVADVAARFGVTEAVVLRRIALARVSPRLLSKYRNGELNLELLQAFTLTDDHSAQEQVWDQLQPWDRKPQTVRQMLAGEDIPASDKRVRFVGLENYESATGIVRRDLFAEGEAGTYITDAAKLNRLVSEKLQMLAEDAKAEGWKWVEIQPEIDHQALSRYRRVYAPELPLSREAQAEIDELQHKRGLLTSQLEQEGDADESGVEEVYEQIDDIDHRIQSIRRNRRAAYSDEVKATCGVVVSVGQNGEPALVYGLLKKEDEKAVTRTEQPEEETRPAESGEEPESQSPAYSAALIESLTQHKTAAIAVELSQQPAIALAAIVHALVLSEFGLDLQLYRSSTCVQISAHEAYLGRATDSPALATLENQKREWLQKLAAAKDDLWLWCLRQDQKRLLELLAHCVARSVNGAKSKSDSDSNGNRFPQADALASALQFDMTEWFTPTAGNYFSRVPKSRIAHALAEAGKRASAEALKLKKTELAALAENEVRGTGWLPKPVRIPRAMSQLQAASEQLLAND